jgi:hypothetical protein
VHIPEGYSVLALEESGISVVPKEDPHFEPPKERVRISLKSLLGRDGEREAKRSGIEGEWPAMVLGDVEVYAVTKVSGKLHSCTFRDEKFVLVTSTEGLS